MMNPAADVVTGFAALILAASLVLYPDAPMPRPKPMPPAPSTSTSSPPATSAPAIDEKEQERAKQIKSDLKAAERDIAEIKNFIKLQQAVKGLPAE